MWPLLHAVSAYLVEGDQKIAFHKEIVMHTPTVSKFFTSLSAAIFALVAFTSITPANAQNTLRVDVPFAFESGTTHFVRGVYNIHLDRTSPFIRIEGPNQSAFQMTIADFTQTPADRGKIVFRRLGNLYLLKEIWVAGSTSQMHTPKSKLEKELELAQVQTKQAPQGTVALLAMPRR